MELNNLSVLENIKYCNDCILNVAENDLRFSMYTRLLLNDEVIGFSLIKHLSNVDEVNLVLKANPDLNNSAESDEDENEEEYNSYNKKKVKKGYELTEPVFNEKVNFYAVCNVPPEEVYERIKDIQLYNDISVLPDEAYIKAIAKFNKYLEVNSLMTVGKTIKVELTGNRMEFIEVGTEVSEDSEN